ncbi:hypothetical protein Dimus_004122 [Dionaea muscipula]
MKNQDSINDDCMKKTDSTKDANTNVVDYENSRPPGGGQEGQNISSSINCLDSQIGSELHEEGDFSQVSRIGYGRCLRFDETGKPSVEDRASSHNPRQSQVGYRIISTMSSNTQSKATPLKSANMMVSSSISGNSDPSVPRPPSIGLHLNSVVSAGLLRGEIESAQTSESFAIGNDSLLIGGSSFSSNVDVSSMTWHVDVSPGCTQEILESKAREAVSSGNLSSGTWAKHSSDTLTMEPYRAPLHDCKKRDLELPETLEEFNQANTKKNRKKEPKPAKSGGSKRCNCKKSKCLKLYCDCFAARCYCSESCACHGCCNKEGGKDIVLETRQQIQVRNSLAFAPKVTEHVLQSSLNPGEITLSSLLLHKRGCNCKRSKCLKKYCECYQANVGCSNGCRCEGCENTYGKAGDYVMIRDVMDKPLNAEISESRLNGMLEVSAARDGIPLDEAHGSSNLTPVTVLLGSPIHPKFNQNSGRHILSLGSDLTAFSSSKNYPTSARFLDSMLLNSSEDSVDASYSPYDYSEMCHGPTNSWEFNSSRLNHPHIPSAASSLERRYSVNYLGIQLSSEVEDPLTNNSLCFTTPLRDQLLITAATSSSSVKRVFRSTWGAQVSSAFSCPPMDSSLCWQGLPVTPDTEYCGSRISNEIPKMLKDPSTPIKSVKISSPNKKRISPPHINKNQLGSNSLGGLRSKRLLMQAVPPPCINSKQQTSVNKSESRDS